MKCQGHVGRRLSAESAAKSVCWSTEIKTHCRSRLRYCIVIFACEASSAVFVSVAKAGKVTKDYEIDFMKAHFL